MHDHCTNCATPYDGVYCPSCGQRSGGLDVPLGTFTREFASEALGLDSRVRLTLPPLLFRPGAVAKDYVEGRRARFVPPIRLYLLASFVMFLVLSQAGVNVENVRVNGEPVVVEATEAGESLGVADVTEEPEETMNEPPSGARSLEEQLGGRLAAGFAKIAEDREAFSRLFFSRLAQSMFFLLPAFALLLKAVYWRRPYLHHGVFAIYLHCFVFLVVAIGALPEVFGFVALSGWTDALLLVVPVYFALALRRFYGEGWVRTIAKGAVVSIAYGMLGGATVMLLLVIALMTL